MRTSKRNLKRDNGPGAAKCASQTQAQWQGLIDKAPWRDGHGAAKYTSQIQAQWRGLIDKAPQRDGHGTAIYTTSVRVPRKAKIVLHLAKIFFLCKNAFK